MIWLTIYLILLAIATVVGFRATYRYINGPKETIKALESKSMSLAGKQLLKEYDALPAEHRPDIDLKAIVEALDIKYPDISKLNYHFAADFNLDRVSWTRHESRLHDRNRCPYSEYMNLHNEIQGIQKELAAREHKLKLAGVQHSLDELSVVTQRLREERQIIASVTRELT